MAVTGAARLRTDITGQVREPTDADLNSSNPASY
jgi:hypothetical protein